MTRAIAFVIIALVALGALVFIIFRSGGSSTSAPATTGAVTTPSGLQYVDEVEGTGASPKQGQNVTVHYTGTLQDGTKFESSLDRGQPYTFKIGTASVIQGWDEGIMTMKVGGKRRLIIPGKLGYGPAGNPPKIPPNATLIFEIQLLGAQ
jgi:peptidylprolyl isomerase